MRDVAEEWIKLNEYQLDRFLDDLSDDQIRVARDLISEWIGESVSVMQVVLEVEDSFVDGMGLIFSDGRRYIVQPDGGVSIR